MSTPTVLRCQICGHESDHADPNDLGAVRGNTARFCQQMFHLWKCPRCLTIYSIDPVDFHDIYGDYALLKRRIDIFARSTLRNLTRRLERVGLKKHHTMLDYGCGNGIYLQYLNSRGYRNVAGYDPFVPEYAELPSERAPFDFVVNNDTIEHCDDVRSMTRACVDLLKPGGVLYVGTADSEPVDMHDLEPHVMRLHQPFHRTIFTEATLQRLGVDLGLEVIGSYRRSYHDTLRPFANYRFLDELSKAVGHNLDRALDPNDSGRVVMRTPMLWLYGLFGYFFPSAYEPAIILRKPA